LRIRPVEKDDGHESAGYVVEALGQVDHRVLRHEACERVLAIFEKEVDELRHLVEALVRDASSQPAAEPEPADSPPVPPRNRERDTDRIDVRFARPGP
jgi:hypothetical protein